MQQTRKRISSGARNDGYLSTPGFPKKSEGDHVVANQRILSAQQPAKRAAHQRAAD
jgi:hypothetical protein